MIDDLVADGVRRFDVKARIDEVLARPLAEDEALEYDRERWGAGPEAVQAAQAKDALWGDLTYGEEVAA